MFIRQRIVLLAFLITFLITACYAGQARETKIAIASEARTSEAMVSDKAGRSPYFLIFNKYGKIIEVIENPYKDAERAAGTKVAYFLAEKAVTLLVAGTFGPKMVPVLESKNIAYVEFKGNVEDAIKSVLDKEVELYIPTI